MYLAVQIKRAMAMCGLSILTVVSTTLGLHVTFQQPSYEVAQGDNVTLICTFQPKSPDNPLIIISWERESDYSKDHLVPLGTYHYSSRQFIAPEYKGKASMENSFVRGEAKLTLAKVTLRENRTFHCRVEIAGDNEGQLSDNTSVLVLAAPSKPICEVQGTAEYGHNINLTCLSEEGSPTPSYQWQGYDIKNVPSQHPPKATEKNGVLFLFNISMETSGYFICTSTNKIGSASCNLTLTASIGSTQISVYGSGSRGSTVWIVAIIVGIEVLVLCCYCIYRNLCHGDPLCICKGKGVLKRERSML